MDNERLSNNEIVDEYKESVRKLNKYIPWLESKQGLKTSSSYDGNGVDKVTMSIPVYDSTLLSFVNEARRTNLVERNYEYAYSKYRMKTDVDELIHIGSAKITDMSLLKGILSKYVLKGMTKASLWTEGVENGVLLAVLCKMRELIEFYQGPIEK